MRNRVERNERRKVKIDFLSKVKTQLPIDKNFAATTKVCKYIKLMFKDKQTNKKTKQHKATFWIYLALLKFD